MTLKTEQKLIAHDGKYIVLPPWKGGEDDVVRSLAVPDVYVLDKTQKYPIGTKFVDGDRVFHYGYCYSKNSAAGRASGGMKNLALVKETTTKLLTVEPIGETEIEIVDTKSALNQWAGGYYMPYVTTGLSTYRILSNTKSDGAHVTLTLERGLLVASTAGMTVRISQNQYSKLSCELPNAGAYYASSMGVNLVEAGAGKWLWIQTWGPCYVHGGDDLLGKDAADRMGTFHIDGTLMCPINPAAGASQHDQIAGYAINRGDGTAEAWFVFLQLAC